MDSIMDQIEDLGEGLGIEMSEEEVAKLAEEAEREKQRQAEIKLALSQILLRNRDAAVNFRMASGIEIQWLEDQSYYEGQESNSRTEYYKGQSAGSPLIKKPKSQYRSKVFLNITQPYVEVAASKVIDVLAPVDDRNFSIEPKPLPSTLAKNSMPLDGFTDANGQPLSPAQIVEALKERSRISALGAQEWVDDKLQLCGFAGELRTVVDDAARLGTGIMKGPVPMVRTGRRVTEGGRRLESVSEIAPISKAVSCWNLFPDPACGDNIHNGQFVIELDNMTDKQVRKLAEDDSYDAEAIQRVLEEGPKRYAHMAENPHDPLDPVARRFPVWYYYGFISEAEAASLGCEYYPEDVSVAGLPVVITMINDTPIKANLNPMSDGHFPYDVMCWQKQAGSPWGIGISRQIRSCQSILNASVRSLMENAGLSSGPQIILGRGAVIPADGQWEITPRKVWLLKPDADIADVQKAFNAVQIPSIQAELLQAVDFALKMAENVTGLPVLLQGQQGPNGVPDTVGGMQILVANASSLLRRIARVFDDTLIKPHIQAYYAWMMEFGDDDSIKGDFQVIARGSSALVARDVRNTFLMQSVPQLMANPAYGIDPTRLFKQIARLNGLNAEDVQFTKEELSQLAQQEQPVDPRVQVAQIRAESDQTIAGIEAEIAKLRVDRDIDRDTAYVQAENQRTEINLELKLRELELRRELALIEAANREKLSLDQLKAKLADSSAKIDLQRELASLQGVSAQALRAPVEPAGRAPNGQAFTA